MTSTITLYKDSKIIPSKNFVVEGIETYLAGLTYISRTNFQYIRNDLNIAIKLNKGQDFTDSVYSNNYNYLKVAQNGSNYYYFIVKKTQLSQETIVLELVMDTLNTYPWDTAFKISPRTKVSREHKDRFAKDVYYDHFEYNTLTEIRGSINYNTDYIGEIHFADGFSFKTTLHTFRNYEPDQISLTFPNGSFYSEFINRVEHGESYIFSNASYEFEILGHSDSHVEFRLIKKIDLKSEEIPAPLYKIGEDTILERGLTNDWALYYKNRNNENSPVDCYLMGDTPLEAVIHGSNEITASDIPSNKYVLLSAWYTGRSFFVSDDDGNYYIENFNITPNRVGYNCLVLWNDGGTLKIRMIQVQYEGTSNTAYIVSANSWPNYRTPNGSLIVHYNATSLPCREMASVVGPWTGGTTAYPFYKSRANYTISLDANTTYDIKSKTSIDKTLSDNIKIINLPYSPSNFVLESNKVNMDTIWTYDATYSFFRLADLNSKFENNIETDLESILKDFESGLYLSDIEVSDGRWIEDPKLLHSDFYYKKFVYDSFGRIFPLEKIDYYESCLSSENYQNLSFTFITSRNIVSKFLFKFDLVYKYATEDYPNILPVERNNEEVLYNSSYINYIRNGYNYDIKAKKRNEVVSGATIGISALGTILSAAAGGPFGAAAAVGFGVSLLTSLVNYAKTEAQNEENIARKIQEANRQANSVVNADDYDLLEAYSNKAKICKYEVSPMLKGILDDIFYYFGYKVDEMKIPSTNTRYWFNFVACELEYTGLDKNISESARQNLIGKYREGATFLHMRKISAVDTWDFEQVKENWENNLIEE